MRPLRLFLPIVGRTTFGRTVAAASGDETAGAKYFCTNNCIIELVLGMPI
jgi:hypothetical protein